MKIAFIHDRLYYIAGAEQVFFQMIEEIIRRDALVARPENQIFTEHYRIFTMFSDKQFLIIHDRQIPIITALPRWIFVIFVYFDKHKIPYISKLLDYRNLMFFYPLLIRILQRKINRYHPSQAHISSFAVAKNIAPASQHSDLETSIHLHAQSPFMYIHNHYHNNLKKLQFPIKQFYELAHRFLSPRDLKSRTYNKITANSSYTAGLIQHIYGLPVHDIHYPKLDPLFSQFPVSTTRSDYFVFIGRLVTFSKQVDIIIQAFNESKHKLVIIGSGPDEQYLQFIAGPNIEFLGRIADPLERCRIIGNACGLVNITMESFGYVTAESVCLGTPVIGYNKGATPEIVDTESGLLIAYQDKKDLKQAITKFLQKDRNYSEISTRARAKFTFSDLKFELK